jgi:hypothetical protein
MPKTLTSVAVSILAFTLITIAVPASAATKNTDAVTARRYAAIEACSRQAQAQSPGEDSQVARQRGLLYVAGRSESSRSKTER